jgi:hypothetical protein
MSDEVQGKVRIGDLDTIYYGNGVSNRKDRGEEHVITKLFHDKKIVMKIRTKSGDIGTKDVGVTIPSPKKAILEDIMYANRVRWQNIYAKLSDGRRFLIASEPFVDMFDPIYTVPIKKLKVKTPRFDVSPDDDFNTDLHKPHLKTFYDKRYKDRPLVYQPLKSNILVEAYNIAMKEDVNPMIDDSYLREALMKREMTKSLTKYVDVGDSINRKVMGRISNDFQIIRKPMFELINDDLYFPYIGSVGNDTNIEPLCIGGRVLDTDNEVQRNLMKFKKKSVLDIMFPEDNSILKTEVNVEVLPNHVSSEMGILHGLDFFADYKYGEPYSEFKIGRGRSLGHEIDLYKNTIKETKRHTYTYLKVVDYYTGLPISNPRYTYGTITRILVDKKDGKHVIFSKVDGHEKPFIEKISNSYMNQFYIDDFQKFRVEDNLGENNYTSESTKYGDFLSLGHKWISSIGDLKTHLGDKGIEFPSKQEKEMLRDKTYQLLDYQLTPEQIRNIDQNVFDIDFMTEVNYNYFEHFGNYKPIDTPFNDTSTQTYTMDVSGFEKTLSGYINGIEKFSAYGIIDDIETVKLILNQRTWTTDKKKLITIRGKTSDLITLIEKFNFGVIGEFYKSINILGDIIKEDNIYIDSGLTTLLDYSLYNDTPYNVNSELFELKTIVDSYTGVLKNIDYNFSLSAINSGDLDKIFLEKLEIAVSVLPSLCRLYVGTTALINIIEETDSEMVYVGIARKVL